MADERMSKENIDCEPEQCTTDALLTDAVSNPSPELWNSNVSTELISTVPDDTSVTAAKAAMDDDSISAVDAESNVHSDDGSEANSDAGSSAPSDGADVASVEAGSEELHSSDEEPLSLSDSDSSDDREVPAEVEESEDEDGENVDSSRYRPLAAANHLRIKSHIQLTDLMKSHKEVSGSITFDRAASYGSALI